MVVKSELKLVKSLQQKKYRNEHGLFVIEGKKAVEEVLSSHLTSFKVYALGGLDLESSFNEIIEISQKELEQMSSLKNPNGVIGVFHIPLQKKVTVMDWVLVLDGIQDPGNMGTIIRLCDWFGVRHLVCSKKTVDCYNPKVLQATMGSITRVNIVYTDLEDFLKTTKLPVFGSFMNGDNIYKSKLPETGILVMGNEGSGISSGVKVLCSHTITVPQFGAKTAESLNVATASAILLSELRRS